MVKGGFYTVAGRAHAETAHRENVGFADVGAMASRRGAAFFNRRNVVSIMGGSIFGFLVALLYLLYAQPVYTARAQLLVDLKLPQFLQGTSPESAFGLDASQLESHIVLLQSERVATTVIKKLGLLQDREFQFRPTPYGWLNGLQPASGGELQYAIERFEDHLKVRRIGISYAVEVGFTSEDGEKAANIANATIEAYLQSLVDFRAEAARVSVQSDASAVSNVHLVSKALAPTRRSWPKAPIVIALAVLIGAFVGGCAALARGIFARREDVVPLGDSR